MRKAYRQACAVLAIEQGAQKYPAANGADVHMRFVPPNRARRDLDNCIASIKSGLDGLADALGMDDHKWRLSAEMAEDGEIGGLVRVTVTIR